LQGECNANMRCWAGRAENRVPIPESNMRDSCQKLDAGHARGRADPNSGRPRPEAEGSRLGIRNSGLGTRGSKKPRQRLVPPPLQGEGWGGDGFRFPSLFRRNGGAQRTRAAREADGFFISTPRPSSNAPRESRRLALTAAPSREARQTHTKALGFPRNKSGVNPTYDSCIPERAIHCLARCPSPALR
jgi:hypothetical protein